MEYPPTKIDGKCDICTKPDGSRDHMNLQCCKQCGVLVHELCYGMVPTTTKDVDFVCHACAAVGKEVEVNEPSKVGGVTMRDILMHNREGVMSFGDFLKSSVRGVVAAKQSPAKKRRKIHKYYDLNTVAVMENIIDFYIAADDFRSGFPTNGNVARKIYETYISDTAPKRVHLPLHVVDKIEAKMVNVNHKINDERGKKDEAMGEYDDGIEETFFDEAQREVLSSLEHHSKPFFVDYQTSTSFQTYMLNHRSSMQQLERPTECALCSVKTGIHAMHPLYDQFGKLGRQLVLPASGVGFMKKERRLAWVHTLCAMFISSNERTGGMVYGCSEDGEAEEEESDDEDDSGKERFHNTKVIDSSSSSSSSSSEDEDLKQVHSLEKEQKMFSKCEEVFVPLIDRLRDAAAAASAGNSSAENDILECINSMIQKVDLLTPPFLREYLIVKLILSVKASYDEKNRQIKTRCKLLRKEMKRVYSEKEKNVPGEFVAVKRRQAGKDTPKPINDVKVMANSAGGNGNGADENEAHPTECQEGEQQYGIGTAIVKQVGTANRTGSITSYDAKHRSYRVMFSQGDLEELSEAEVSHLLLTSTAWFCIAAPTNGEENCYSMRVKAHRELTCMICKKKDNTSKNCLRIPVQCNVGDECEFEEFKKYHATSKRSDKKGGINNDGCTEAMHVGCARWGSEYAKVNNKDLRLCYYFSGKPPTYSGEDEYQNPVSNCFCRIHAREIQEGMQRDKVRDSKLHNCKGELGSGTNDHDSDDSTLRAKQHIAILRKKEKKRIILEESDDGGD